MKFVSVAEMQTIEREANSLGLTYDLMMENAGQGIAETIQEEYGFLESGGALGLVGSGNNGGDTLVALALLAKDGWRTTAFIVRPRPEDDPLVSRLKEQGGKVIWWSDETGFSDLARELKAHALLLDGVLGTGFRLPLKPELANILDFCREFVHEEADPPVVVGVDCPSGVDCDTGETAPECIPCELTVTMAAVKQGMFKFPAYQYLGTLRLVGIGLPDGGEALQSWRAVQNFIVDEAWVRQVLPSRPLDAHKGTFGTALIVAGSANYTGAAWLAGQAAYRIGAGLVTLAVPSILHPVLAGSFPEATWLPLPDEDGAIAASAEAELMKNLSRVTAILLGPGFGIKDTTGEFLRKLLSKEGTEIPYAASTSVLPPAVVDADGLKLISRLPGWPELLPKSTILTPHPGEMSILTELSTSKIQADRLDTARRFSAQWGHVVVLKGAFTVVANPDGRVAVIPVATPALAKAGSGDVLAGLIVGLRAQGVAAFEAAAAGSWIHANAGLFAAQTLGNETAVLAGDLLKAISEVLTEMG